MVLRQKSKDSLTGRVIAAFFGLAIFGGSFFVLWFNEGRTNFADVAKKSIPTNASSIDSSLNGELVAAQGDLTSDETVGDPSFLQPNNYIQLERTVEMYAWEETEETVEIDDTTEEVYYYYNEDWTAYPEDSSQFYDTDYYNPPMQISAETFTVSTANVGAYQVIPRSMDFPQPEPLNLNNETYSSNFPINAYVTGFGDYIYIGDFTIEDPDIGDLRVSFAAVPQTDNVTVFGEVSGNQIIPHVVGDNETLYRVFFTDRASAIVEMENEYSTALWGTRAAGFFMMWCGMFLMFFPLTFLISFLPLLERFGNLAIGALTFLAAAVISTIVIIISFVLHNIWVLIGMICLVVLIFGGAGAGLFAMSKRNQG